MPTMARFRVGVMDPIVAAVLPFTKVLRGLKKL